MTEGKGTTTRGQASAGPPGADGGAGPSSTANHHADLADQIVLHFLKERGYTAAEQALKQDVQPQSLDELYLDAILDQTAAQSVTNTIFFWNQKEASNVDAYARSYLHLTRFIDSSLDLYKTEMGLVLYPLFVHCYLELIARGNPTEGAVFFQQYQKQFADEFGQDLSELSTLTQPQHVAENALAQTFRKNKYIVPMCSYSFELLVGFLEQHQYMLLLRLVNQFLDIQITSSAPIQDVEEANRPIGLVGEEEVSRKRKAAGPRPQQGSLRVGPMQPDAALLDQIKKRLEWVDAKTQAEAPTSALHPTEEAPKSGQLASEWQKHVAESQTNGPDRLDPNNSTSSNASKPTLPLPISTMAEVQHELKALQDARDRLPLHTNAQPSIACYTFHNTYDTLNCLSFSEDRELVAAGTSESTIHLWHLRGEKLKGLKEGTAITASDYTEDIDLRQKKEPIGSDTKKLVGHAGPVYSTSFSFDSRYLISGSEDGTARLWSMDTFSPLVAYQGHNYPIWDVDFGPMGIYFATASRDRTARLWSCEHITPLRIFAGHLSDVDCVKFHPNSAYIATGSSDKTVRLWDVQRAECVRLFTGHTAPVRCLDFSPDGRMLATAGEDHTVNIYDIGSGTRMHAYRQAHQRAIHSIAFSADSAMVASAGDDGIVKTWEVKHGEVKRKKAAGEKQGPVGVFATRDTPIYKLAFTPKNVLLAGAVAT